jgi:adenylosuccinate synthase
MTDYYSSLYDDAIVVRSNGGAQAGHTVTTPDGNRHVFSHFGSGSLNGTPTFLSKHFVCNPLLFKKEHEAFVEEFGIIPKVYVSGSSLITTPYDMLLNQTHENMRGDDPHGSCGVGFGETFERRLMYDSIYMADIRYYINDNDPEDLPHWLRSIRDEYVPTRVDLSKVGEEFIKILNSDELINDFIEACKYMLKYTEYAEIGKFEKNTLIFEGAQGLLLDMDYGYFPHVTRSNCGMKNVVDILDDMYCVELDITVNYVTRAYTTRHGAGPLDNEDPLIFERHNIVDNTNITNEWQGSLRAAPLNLDLFNSVTDKDFLNYAPRGAKKVTTVTCLDQLEGETTWYAKGVKRYMSADTIRSRASEIFTFGSYGPTRQTIEKFD